MIEIYSVKFIKYQMKKELKNLTFNYPLHIIEDRKYNIESNIIENLYMKKENIIRDFTHLINTELK